MDFIHLHNHSDYSILDGAITVKNLVSKTVEMGMPGVALTDHGNMFGAIEFYQLAKQSGIKPIIGQEFYIAPRSRLEKDHTKDESSSSFHLLLLAQNLTGYKNLMKLSSDGYIDGFYYKPRIDMEILEKHSAGLICSTACLKGEVSTLIIKDKIKQASNLAGKFKEIFGRDNYYLELQDHGIPEQRKANAELVNISKSLDIPLIATNDCHYPEKKDALFHEILLCIQTGKTMEDKKRMRFSSDQFYFKSPDEMQSLFSDYPEALTNTVRLMDMIDLDLNLGNSILPNFKVPEGYDLDSYLKELVYKGAADRFGKDIPEEVKKRIDYELSVIINMKFSGYFLIVWDFINYANRAGIPVGPGRGSAAGSMVSYCLDVTQLDPMRYNLLFERFLNPDRNEMPDMDIDFCAEKREEIIKYVKEKYGGDERVSQIITFNKMKAKAVVKDVARALNIPFSEANQISKMITEETLPESLLKSKELKKLFKENEKVKELIDSSLVLEGLIRSAGKHAAGVVISKESLTEYVPLYKDSDGVISTQFEKMSLESAGLVKMDILGLKNLTIIDKCLELIKRNRNIVIDIKKIPLDDRNTFELLQRADTNGVFQLESSGMQNILLKMGATEFEDIIAIVALFRPGPLDSGMVDDYIRRKRNPDDVSYQHEILEPILKDTLGVVVYQEQVMLISQRMGGFTLSEADKLRKAMSKKNPEGIDELEEKFLNGAKEKGINIKIAKNIFTMMKKFGRYGFNKSHSAAYAMVTYQTAYLKANYPLEYMAALLSAQQDNQTDIIKYINDCKFRDIQIFLPDVNSSEMDFTIEGNSVRFGLSAIKGVGEKAIESILNARNRMGSFKTIKDFLEKIDQLSVNRGVFESLIKAGAFDPIYNNRASLFVSVDKLIETAKQLQQDKASGQGNLFDFMNENNSRSGNNGIELADISDWESNEKLAYEKEVLGIYISGHPLLKYDKEIQDLPCTTISELLEKKTNGETPVIGIMNDLKIKASKNGNRFAEGIIEDMGGVVSALIFNKILTLHEELLICDEPLIFKGNMEFEDDKPMKYIVNSVQTLKEYRFNSISA
ncbi:MAG: DNA polymerase III subunit alpha, partial [Spirochaetota bacterium]|nr:DNA polymerase III subunit alpha [Spirochaetota bacterium]